MSLLTSLLTPFGSGGSNEQAIWGYQDFLAGAINTTSVTLAANSNGVSAIFDPVKLINSSAALFRQDGISYAFTGSIALFSSKVTVVSQVGSAITLSGIPHASWGTLRIWYQIKSTVYPENYTNPPLTVQDTVVGALGALFEEEENKAVNFATLNHILYPSVQAVETRILAATPAIGAITGLGTGVAAALAVNVGTAGAPVINGGALGTPSSGTATNLSGTAASLTAGNVTTNANLTGEVTSIGNAATLTNSAVIAKVLTGYTSGAGTITATDTILTAIQKLNGNNATNANLTGDVTSVGNATTLTNAPVIAKVLTGYVSGAGTVAATDSILTAIQKLNGNDATNANLTGPITSTGNATSIASQTGTGTTFVMSASPTLTGTALTSALTASGKITANASLDIGGTAQSINLNGATSNTIIYNTIGGTPPTFTTRSNGTKIVLFPELSAIATDYALGIGPSTFWTSVAKTSASFKWYAGITEVASLSGFGDLTISERLTQKRYSLLATNNGAQSIPSGVSTAVSFGTDVTNNNFGSRAADITKFIPPAGTWIISFAINYTSANATNLREAFLQFNGDDNKRYAPSLAAGMITGPRFNGTITLTFNGTDYIRLIAFQDSGSALNVGGSYPSSIHNTISFERLS